MTQRLPKGRRLALASTVVAMAYAGACSTDPLDPNATKPFSVKDMLVATNAEQTLRVRTANGLWMEGTQSYDGSLGFRKGASIAVMRPSGGFDFSPSREPDIPAALRAASITRSPRVVFQILNLRGPGADRQKIGVVKEPNQPVGAPPRAVILYKGSRPSALMEFEYSTLNGRRVPKSLKVSVFDPLTLEATAQLKIENSQIEQIAASGITAMLGDVASVVRTTFSPGVLHAEEETVAGCWRELWEWGVESARLTKMIIDTAAMALECNNPTSPDFATCIDRLEMQGELLIVQGQVVALKWGLYQICKEEQQLSGGSGGGGGDPYNDPNSGEYDWCNYTIDFDAEGNVTDITENYCGYGSPPGGEPMQ